MAFNPFHGFRKHSKVIFAILTIICMITFILSFGRNDFFEWLGSLIGAGKKGDAVTTLYDKKVYLREVQDRQNDREVAKDFLNAAAFLGGQTVEKQAVDELNKLIDAPDLPDELAAYRDALKNRYLQRVILSVSPEDDPLLKKIVDKDVIAAFYVNRVKRARETNNFQDLSQVFTQLQQLSAGMPSVRNKLRNSDRTTEARLLTALIGDEISSLTFDRGLSTQDILDSMVWLHQADSLGIRLTEEDIRKEINRVSPTADALTGDSETDSKFMQRIFANRDRDRKRDLTLATLYRALGDELRIHMAEAVILGGPGGRSRSTVYRPFTAVAPGEYLDYYRDQRTTMKVTLLPVPVRAFLGAIPGQPSERDLEKFFDTYKGAENMPWSLTPGFKRPQKVALQWIITANVPEKTFAQIAAALPLSGAFRNLSDPREQHYQNLAGKILRVGGNPLPGPALLGPGKLLPAWQLLDVIDELNTAYDNLKFKYPVPSLFQGDPALAYYTALDSPAVIAATVAQTAPNGTLASGLSPLVTSQASAVAHARVYEGGKLKKDIQAEAIKAEAQQRARAIASALGTSAGGPALTRWAPWVWADYQEPRLDDFRAERYPVTPPLNSFVSQAGLRSQVLDMATRSLALRLRSGDLQQLAADLDKNNDREAVEKVLREARKEDRPWWDQYTGKTKEPVDKYTFLTAPELRPLRNLLGITSSQSQEEQVGRIGQFFATKDSKLYKPQSGRGLIWWKTQDIPASTPSWPLEAEVRKEVVEAWQLMEARERARREAERIRAKVHQTKPDEALQALRMVLADNPSWGGLIQFDEVGRQVAKPNPLAGDKKEYEPFKVPHDEIPYPPEDFVDQLLKLKEGEAGLIQDRPSKTFYVVYVEKRSPPPSIEEVVAGRRRIGGDGLWDQATAEQRNQYIEAIKKELRREAGKLNAQGRFELAPGFRKDDRDRGDRGDRDRGVLDD